MWYIENRKGKPETHGLPSGNYNNCFIQPFTIGSSGRLFLSPEDLFTQTHKSDNEYHELNQISILIFIVRYTLGYQRNESNLTNKFISNGTGIDERQVRRVIARLEKLELISTSYTQGHRQRMIKLREGMNYPGYLSSLRRVKLTPL